MRALFRLGKSRDAVTILGRLKVEDLEAEDLFLFGKSLISEGQDCARVDGPRGIEQARSEVR